MAHDHLTKLTSQLGMTGPRPLEVAKQFLEYVAVGKGIDCGTKGGRFAWGIVGNNTNPHEFVEMLRPFWNELLSHFAPPQDPSWEGPAYYESVLVFYESYEAGHAGVIEIRNQSSLRDRQIDLVIHHLASLPLTLCRSAEYEPIFESWSRD
jgi:hypothetical protein